ncbi:Protease 2 [Hordeum vulgare]|nr:Protease 2 [Hordeum vulgare]
MDFSGGATLSEMYQSAQRLLLSARDGVTHVERLASAPASSSYSVSAPPVGTPDPAGAEAVRREVAQIQGPALALHPHQGPAQHVEEVGDGGLLLPLGNKTESAVGYKKSINILVVPFLVRGSEGKPIKNRQRERKHHSPSLDDVYVSLASMGRLIDVHYMNKKAFLTNNVVADEEAIVFYTSPSYDDLVAKVRHVLEWMDINDGVKLIGSDREDKGAFVEKIIMIDATNAYSQPPTSKESEVELYAPNACSKPPASQANEVDVIGSEKVIQKDGDRDVDGDLDEVEEGFHGIDVGDLDAYIAQKEMDHQLPFSYLYGYGSDDEGREEELDENGFTKEENQIHFELTVLEKITHLFRDLSLAHKAIVDGGMRNTMIEPTPCPDPGEPSDEEEGENAYLKKGVQFPTLVVMKVWLGDYAIRNHKPFYVEHSDINLCYTVKCEKGDEEFPWKTIKET